MATQEVTVEDLDQALDRSPVFARVHPLVPLCLRDPTIVAHDDEQVLEWLDDPSSRPPDRLLILSDSARLRERFPRLTCLAPPTAETANATLHQNLGYARRELLTTHGVAAHIAREVRRHNVDTVVLVLVDGLGYGDASSWPCDVQPCFVDGPSITFGYTDELEKKVCESIGFPAIVGRPSIHMRLYQQGFHTARGYTYWNRDNRVADYLFTGVPTERVTDFEEALERISLHGDLRGSYVQIMREGLDGLAHSKRELRPVEVHALVAGILNDVIRLSDVLARKGLHAIIFVTADHGVLWKGNHEFRVIPGVSTRHPRYTVEPPQSARSSHLFVPVPVDEGEYWLLRYPYLGCGIRANDSGVHGGLSYEESLVPFATFEVRPKCS